MALDRWIHLRVSDDLYRAIEAAANREEQTMAAVARRILKTNIEPPRTLVDTREHYTTKSGSNV